MKRITIANLEDIKNKHFNYCMKDSEIAIAVAHLSENQKRLLFTGNPVDYSQENALSKDFDFLPSIQQNFKAAFENRYKKFRSSKSKKAWSGLRFIESLNLEVCPYCGMNYFSITKKGISYVAEATLDHYFPKSDFPFLALNIFNLIPSCSACNTVYKTTDKRPILSPYLSALDNCIDFYISPEDILSFLTNGANFDVKINNIRKGQQEEVFVDNQIETLALENRYQKRHSIAESIITKRIWYNGAFMEQIENLGIEFCAEDFENMFIKQDLYGKDEPFSKFKKDIWKLVETTH